MKSLGLLLLLLGVAGCSRMAENLNVIASHYTGQDSGAEKAVLASLRDPDSAKFGKFTLVGQDRACLTVNARNSVGGYTGIGGLPHDIGPLRLKDG
jgi:hypothetical protein